MREGSQAVPKRSRPRDGGKEFTQCPQLAPYEESKRRNKVVEARNYKRGKKQKDGSRMTRKTSRHMKGCEQSIQGVACEMCGFSWQCVGLHVFVQQGFDARV